MTEVHAHQKIVINLGNYESYHIEFGVTDSVREDESITDAARRVTDLVERYIEYKATEVKKEIRGG